MKSFVDDNFNSANVPNDLFDQLEQLKKMSGSPLKRTGIKEMGELIKSRKLIGEAPENNVEVLRTKLMKKKGQLLT